VEDVKGLLGDSIDNVFDYLIQTDTLTVVILNKGMCPVQGI